MTKQDNHTNQNNKEDVVIGSVKRDPLKLFRKKEQNIIIGKDINKNTNDLSEKVTKKDPNKVIYSKPKKAFKIAYIATIVVLVASVLLNIYFVLQKDNNLVSMPTSETDNLTNDVISESSSGGYAQAEKLINESDSSETLEAQLLLAGLKMKQNQYNEALDILLKAEKKYPNNMALYSSIAICYENLQKNDLSKQYFQKQYDLLVGVPDYPMKKSDMQAIQGKINQMGG